MGHSGQNARRFSKRKVVLPAARGIFGPSLPGFLVEESYEGEAGVIYDCPDARIFHRPHAIISPDDRLFTFASTWHSLSARSHFAFHSLRLGRVRRLRGRTLFLGGASNVWHFYIDYLRQLSLLDYARRSLADFDHIIAKEPLTPIEQRCYEALGISDRALISSSPHEQLKCDHLTFFSTPSRQGRWQPPLLRQLVFRALRIPDSCSGNRRLYISRRNASFRRVLNEHEIIQWLQSLDFEILDLETMKPDEQIHAFRDAEIVIGCHGAGLTQILFSKPGIALIELRNLAFRPENGVSECYRVLSSLLGIDYYAVTTLDTAKPDDPHKSDFRIDLENLKSAVDFFASRHSGIPDNKSLCKRP
jgi:capsular polysaccharide biosynthesis protein